MPVNLPSTTTAIDVNVIEKLPLEQFRRFGIACCYRLACDQRDKRLSKALKKLEQSLGPPLDEKLRRDAYNAANSAYMALYGNGKAIRAVACTLVCASWKTPNISLIGNFESALVETEQLSIREIRNIASDILLAVQHSKAAPEPLSHQLWRRATLES